MLSLPGLLVRWHADLLRGSVPRSPVPSNLRPLRNRRMIFAGPAARLAGRAVRRHDAACLGPGRSDGEGDPGQLFRYCPEAVLGGGVVGVAAGPGRVWGGPRPPPAPPGRVLAAPPRPGRPRPPRGAPAPP